MIPKNLQGVLWSRDIAKLDLKKDKNYIIHNVLMYGTLPDISWLKTVYSKEEISREFVNEPRKLYTNPAFNFIKTYVLGVKKELEQANYVKYLPRNIRQ